MKEIYKGVYCDIDKIEKIRVKQINGDKLATSVYIYFYDETYIYLFFQTTTEARDYVQTLLTLIKEEGSYDTE